MCRQVECSKCQKPTFSGCGMHVEQVLRHIPREARCTCREDAKKGGVTVEASLLQRIFGR